jgi:hypothetical protein
VKDVATIAVDSPDYRTVFTIMLGGAVTMTLDLSDARGRTLKGIGGVDYAFAGGISATELTLASAIVNAIASIFTGTATEYVDLTANALGAGTISITAPSGASLGVPVAIVDESAVERIELCGEFDGTPVANQDSLSIYADAFAAGDEPVHSPECAWSLAPVAGPIAFDSMGRSSVSLSATAPGTATVTCVIGAQSATFDVTFQ